MSSPSKRPLMQKFLPQNKMRDELRHGALSILARLRSQTTERALQRHRVQNLYFHFLPEAEASNFRELIRHLSLTHRFISYSEAVERINSGNIDQPYLSVSFDDGFESNRLAAKILSEEGISACFFVCPEMVGKSRKTLEREFSGSLGNETRMMTWEEIESLIELGHEIGSHTLDHSTLVDIPLEAARRQIVDSKTALELKVGEIQHFAWPRGQFHHFRPELVDTVFEAGYISCASAVRGAHVGQLPDKRGCIKRENCQTDWPIDHILYLIGRSTRHSDWRTGSWPASWLR